MIEHLGKLLKNIIKLPRMFQKQKKENPFTTRFLRSFLKSLCPHAGGICSQLGLRENCKIQFWDEHRCTRRTSEIISGVLARPKTAVLRRNRQEEKRREQFSPASRTMFVDSSVARGSAVSERKFRRAKIFPRQSDLSRNQRFKTGDYVCTTIRRASLCDFAIISVLSLPSSRGLLFVSLSLFLRAKKTRPRRINTPPKSTQNNVH